MAPKDPFGYAFFTYLWVILLAAAGGIASFLSKVRSGEARVFNLVEMLGEMFISGFVGLLTFWLCEAAGISPLISAVLIGISGHMGSRALFMAENFLRRYVERKAETTDIGPP